jgi:hypothetical protein
MVTDYIPFQKKYHCETRSQRRLAELLFAVGRSNAERILPERFTIVSAVISTIISFLEKPNTHFSYFAGSRSEILLLPG